MADKTIPTLRAELAAAVEVIGPQLRGLGNIANDPLTPDALSQVETAISARQRRRQLILQVLADLDQLDTDLLLLMEDGYPLLPPFPVVEAVFQELQKELADLEEAISLFTGGKAETGDFNPERSMKHE